MELGSRTFTLISALTVGLALVVVVLGAYVRLSHAGLSCPDWPGCYGQLLVPADEKAVASANQAYPERPVDAERAWKEMIHRYLAGLLGLAIVVMAFLAYRRRRQPGQPLMIPLLLVALVLFQALLGMWTVTLLLKPLVVVAHLLGGLTTAALCWWVFLRHASARAANGRPPARQPRLPRRLAAMSIVVLLLQIGLGGWTSANYAALACVDFPLCQGQVWPEMAFGEAFLPWRGVGQSYEGGVLATDARVTIHVVHRMGALVTFFFLGFVAVYLMRSDLERRLTTAAGVVLALLVMQVLLGIGNVVLHLPLGVAVAHNAGAALLLLATVSVYHMTVPPKTPT
ncbi:MAG TPA: COX15/CtaA family protein [Gammaproteobacteria bacterium]|nr:COX15/CtaA family protein [Gammaproteobacteria bacterium]